MRSMRPVLLASLLVTIPTLGAAEERRADEVVDRLLASPEIRVEKGFEVELVIPPGELYDPLFMVVRGERMWISDDGGEEGEKGSQIVSFDGSGNLEPVVPLGKMLPMIGWGIAPEDFGEYGGQIFSVAQKTVSMPGATANHMVQRIDVATGAEGVSFCDLPPVVKERPSGFGADARFGPEGSPFADRFFSVTILNDTIYETKADGTCRPFITFDGKPWQAPVAIAFTPDGKEMLVSVATQPLMGPPTEGAGAIVRVTPEGELESEPWARGLTRPFGMQWAPEGFGDHGGELFVSDIGDIEVPVPMTQALGHDGRLLRIGEDRKAVLVASGLVNPAGVEFADGKLFVSDINGDFIAGRRELPDGFVAAISVVAADEE